MPKYGVLPSDPFEFHALDSKGRMKCNDAKPEDMDVVDEAGTFGKELCDGCRKQLTDEDIVDQILDDVEV